MPASEVLRLAGARAGYAGVPVVQDINLTVVEGQAVAIIGANGAGKTTILRAIMGQINTIGGEIYFRKRSLSGLSTHRRARLGIGYAPERRELFPEMTVTENLEMGAFNASSNERGRRVAEMYEIFPKLADLSRTQCRLLSGGEQQMVTIARALMGKPELLILDEPSTGLAPLVISELYSALRGFHGAGLSVLLAEQNARAALAFAQVAYVIEDGRVTSSGKASELLSDKRLVEAYVGTAAGRPTPSAQAGNDSP